MIGSLFFVLLQINRINEDIWDWNELPGAQ